MGIARSSEDSLPADGNRGWRAAVNVGYAVKDEETGRLRFKTLEQMHLD
jgi:hypothetical protein